jgi:hypothetical protein
MYDVNVDGAARLARISREMGVERFIHVSALNASHKPEAHMIPGNTTHFRNHISFYQVDHTFYEAKQRAKMRCERIFQMQQLYAHRESMALMANGYCSQCTLVCSSLACTLLFTFFAVRRIPFSWIELYKGGEYTFKMPVYVNSILYSIFQH